MKTLCSCCRREKEVFMKTMRKENGEKATVYLCSECLSKIAKSDDLIETNKGLVRSDKDFRKTYNENKWTRVVKVLNIIFWVGSAMTGLVFGASIGNNYDGPSLIGGFLGMVAGAFVGAFVVSFSVALVKISQTLDAIYKEVRKDK